MSIDLNLAADTLCEIAQCEARVDSDLPFEEFGMYPKLDEIEMAVALEDIVFVPNLQDCIPNSITHNSYQQFKSAGTVSLDDNDVDQNSEKVDENPTETHFAPSVSSLRSPALRDLDAVEPLSSFDAELFRKSIDTNKYDAYFNCFNYVGPSLEEYTACRHPRDRDGLMEFYRRLNEWLHFRNEHGHTAIPQKDPKNRGLGCWVNKAREEKKRLDKGDNCSTLVILKVKKLNELGFDWGKHRDEIWDKHFQKLVEFKKIHGHCHVPTRKCKDKSFGRWISTMRSEYKAIRNKTTKSRSRLTKERIRLLNEIGFPWTMMAHSSGRATCP